jgi:thiosulfate dehydrogenase (quinone) large subunit
LLIDSNSAGWFSYVIVFGELAVGIGLILGAFVGLAAAGGLLMNLAFLLAGTTSTNPVLAMLGVLLILAWKNAGYIGLDRYLLPLLGTPWQQRHVPAQATKRVTPVPQLTR